MATTFTFSEEEYNDILKRLDAIQTTISENFQPTKELYNNTELMALLKVSRRTLCTWREEYLIEFSQIGSKIYYTNEAVQKFLNRHQIKRNF